jgi:hypothetical protein
VVEVIGPRKPGTVTPFRRGAAPIRWSFLLGEMR